MNEQTNEQIERTLNFKYTKCLFVFFLYLLNQNIDKTRVNWRNKNEKTTKKKWKQNRTRERERQSMKTEKITFIDHHLVWQQHSFRRAFERVIKLAKISNVIKIFYWYLFTKCNLKWNNEKEKTKRKTKTKEMDRFW